MSEDSTDRIADAYHAVRRLVAMLDDINSLIFGVHPPRLSLLDADWREKRKLFAPSAQEACQQLFAELPVCATSIRECAAEFIAGHTREVLGDRIRSDRRFSRLEQDLHYWVQGWLKNMDCPTAAESCRAEVAQDWLDEVLKITEERVWLFYQSVCAEVLSETARLALDDPIGGRKSKLGAEILDQFGSRLCDRPKILSEAMKKLCTGRLSNLMREDWSREDHERAESWSRIRDWKSVPRMIREVRAAWVKRRKQLRIFLREFARNFGDSQPKDFAVKPLMDQCTQLEIVHHVLVLYCSELHDKVSEDKQLGDGLLWRLMDRLARHNAEADRRLEAIGRELIIAGMEEGSAWHAGLATVAIDGAQIIVAVNQLQWAKRVRASYLDEVQRLESRERTFLHNTWRHQHRLLEAAAARQYETLTAMRAEGRLGPFVESAGESLGKIHQPGAAASILQTADAVRSRMTAEEANARACRLAEGDANFIRNPKAREWADRIGCSVGLVPKLPLWQKVMAVTGRGRRNKFQAPKAVSLTDRLESTIGVDDEQLQRLIAESEADNRADPSPLADDPPDRPARRPRQRKEL